MMRSANGPKSSIIRARFEGRLHNRTPRSLSASTFVLLTDSLMQAKHSLSCRFETFFEVKVRGEMRQGFVTSAVPNPMDGNIA